MHELNYDQRVDDYVTFTLYHMMHSPSLRRGLMVARVGFPALWLLLALVTPFPLWRIGWVVLAVLWFALLPWLRRWEAARRIRRMYAEGKHADRVGHVRLTIGSDGIHERTERSETHYKTDALERVVSDVDHVYLYVSPVSALVVPKSAFAGELEETSFVELARQLAAQHAP